MLNLNVKSFFIKPHLKVKHKTSPVPKHSSNEFQIMRICKTESSYIKTRQLFGIYNKYAFRNIND